MDLQQAYASMPADLQATLSVVLITVVGLILVLRDSFRNNAEDIPWTAAIALTAAMVIEWLRLSSPADTAFYGMVRVGGFASFVNLIILIGGLLSVLLSMDYLKRIKHGYGETYALILFAVVGMMLLGTSNNLLTMFVALETMSISLYILTGLVREDTGAIESALKYFLLGSFSSGFFLYGIALLYAATGTMDLPGLVRGYEQGDLQPLFWAGVALLLIGFLFKVSAVPFHMWTPDVYQGAPTTLTGFMSTASKASAFAALIMLLHFGMPPERWRPVLEVIAVLTMVVGNIIALNQENVKRMLAYSSIAHAGYILVALSTGTSAGYSGALVYLLIYTLMNVGAFGVLSLLEWDQKEGSEQSLASLSGAAHKRPVLGVLMGIFMFSLSGFPPMAGFFGKVAVFAPAIDAGRTWLVIIGVLMSAVSAGYYLRVLWVLWMRTPADDPNGEKAIALLPSVPVVATVVLVACAILNLVVGFIPDLYNLTDTYFAPASVTALLP